MTKEKGYADYYREFFKTRQTKLVDAVQKATNRMLAHCIIIEQSGLPLEHKGLDDYKNELIEFADVSQSMLECLLSWDMHADSFDVEDE
jgi:hypothetical protein